MEYEKIILELLVRIKTLEEEVSRLGAIVEANNTKQPGTSEIVEYVISLKRQAKERGEPFLVLKANDVHKKLKLTSRMPAVCNAMKKCMLPNDEIIHETASGFSSTFEVKYNIIE